MSPAGLPLPSHRLEALTDIGAPASRPEEGDQTLRVVEPATGWRFPNFREVWEHRDLIFLLVRRDIAIRYRQSALGAAWVILQPLLLAIVFSLFLGQYANVPSAPGIPYPVYAVSGMVMWLFVSQGLEFVANSTVASSALISRVYFPRVIIPLAAAIPPLVDFAVAFVVVIAAMLVYGTAPSPLIVLLPVVTLVSITTVFGLGLWLAALHVRFRDVQQAVPFTMLLGFFITPIMYPIVLIPAAVKPFYSLNPAVGILEGYRWTIFAGYDFPGVILLIPLVASVVLVVTGLLYFEKMETSFADVI
jgi:lipopolysaccharide transport system permease protein